MSVVGVVRVVLETVVSVEIVGVVVVVCESSLVDTLGTSQDGRGEGHENEKHLKKTRYVDMWW